MPESESTSFKTKVLCTCRPTHDGAIICPHEDECYEEWLYTRIAGHKPDET